MSELGDLARPIDAREMKHDVGSSQRFAEFRGRGRATDARQVILTQLPKANAQVARDEAIAARNDDTHRTSPRA